MSDDNYFAPGNEPSEYLDWRDAMEKARDDAEEIRPYIQKARLGFDGLAAAGYPLFRKLTNQIIRPLAMVDLKHYLDRGDSEAKAVFRFMIARWSAEEQSAALNMQTDCVMTMELMLLLENEDPIAVKEVGWSWHPETDPVMAEQVRGLIGRLNGTYGAKNKLDEIKKQQKRADTKVARDEHEELARLRAKEAGQTYNRREAELEKKRQTIAKDQPRAVRKLQLIDPKSKPLTKPPEHVIPDDERERLIGCLRLTGSPVEGEAVSAVLGANRILAAHNITWENILSTEKDEDDIPEGAQAYRLNGEWRRYDPDTEHYIWLALLSL